MIETHEIVRQIAGSADMLGPAFSLFAAEEDVKLELLGDLRNQITNQLKPDFPDATAEGDLYAGKACSSIAISFGSVSRYRFKLEWAATQFNRLLWGLSRRDEGTDTAQDVKKFGELLSAARQSPDYPWYREATTKDEILPLTRDWRYDACPWEEIAKGEMSRKIAQVAKDFKTKIGDSALF